MQQKVSRGCIVMPLSPLYVILFVLLLLPVLLVAARLLVARWTGDGSEPRQPREHYQNDLTDTGQSIVDPSCQIVASDDDKPVVFSELMRKHPSDIHKCIIPGTGFGVISDPKTCKLKDDVKISNRKRYDPKVPPFTWKNPFSPETAKKGLTFSGRENVLWGEECVVAFKEGLTRAQLTALDKDTYEGALQPLSAIDGGGYLPDAKGIGVLFSVDGTGCAAVTPKGELGFTSCDSQDESQQFLATPLRVGGSKVESMQQHGKCLKVKGTSLTLQPCKDIVDPADKDVSAVDDDWAFSSPIVRNNPLADWNPSDHLIRTAIGNSYLTYDKAKGGVVTSVDDTVKPIAFVPLDLMPDVQVMPAKSTPIPGRFVRLIASNPGCMHVAEVKVYNEAGINVAAGKTVTMSSMSDGNKFPGANLVNTNLKDYAATGCEEVAWMQIDLGGTHNIARIRVTNRLDCCMDQLVGTTVSIINEKKTFVYTSMPLTAEPVQEVDLGNNKKPLFLTGRYVRLQAPKVDCMNVTEVEVFDESGTNLAFRKTVTMSSGYQGNKYPGANLVNGRRNDFAHTSCDEDAWMQIDLGSVHDNITRIRVTNRVDGGQERLAGTIVLLLDEKKNAVFTSEPLTSDAVQEVDLKKNTPFNGAVVSGRYVRLHLPRVECMNIAEVDVLDKYGNRLAFNKPVTMSSGYQGNKFPGGNLVNGNRSDFAHTSCYDEPWMEIDLGSVSDIARVRVTNRVDGGQDRLAGTIVSILDNKRNIVFRSAPLTAEAVQEVDLSQNKPFSGTVVSGRYVRLQLPRVECMNIAEVDVLDKHGNNLALNKPVTMSSGYQGNMFPGGNLVNGNRRDFAHTSCYDEPWMEIDLGSVSEIARISVTNRADGDTRLVGTVVSILDSQKVPVFASIPLTSAGVQEVDLGQNTYKPFNGTVVSGRYVRLHLDRVECMNIAEVDVLDRNGNQLALRMPVTMSSGYQGNMFPGANLVNGNRRDFAHTSCYDKPWMEIDLGSLREIARIRVANRSDGDQRLSGTIVSILDNKRNVVFASVPLSASGEQEVDLSNNNK